MFYIIFCYSDGTNAEVYGGGTYTVHGEKYAVLNSSKPKLYKSKKQAELAGKKLFCSCVNKGTKYEVLETEK